MTLPIPFRAARFAFHLIRIGHTSLLLQQASSFLLSCACKPLWLAFTTKRRCYLNVSTDHPVAYESPDHLQPWGTAHNEKPNYALVLYALWKHGSNGRFLDLGCSCGSLATAFSRVGWWAVGLEGSDYSKRHGRAHWRTESGTVLHTADIGQPFTIKEASGNPATFDLITAWDVLEHLTEPQLVTLFATIQKHTHEGSEFIITTDNTPDVHGGVDLHQTKWPLERWIGFLSEQLPCFELRQDLPLVVKSRHSGRGFNFRLVKSCKHHNRMRQIGYGGEYARTCDRCGNVGEIVTR
jgi:2-polyprenyl-3-methyl-5-hydroxy-6-metoxy-1,4-benzoquinol methylase